jgi:hypothetical protein
VAVVACVHVDCKHNNGSGVCLAKLIQIGKDKQCTKYERK